MYKTTYKIFLFLVLVTLLIRCDNYEFPKPPYPRLEILPVTNISESRATLKAKITQLGGKEITNHGFIWALDESLTFNRDTIQLGAISTSGVFKTEFGRGHYTNKRHWVMSYIQTEEYIVYSDIVEFKFP